MPIARRPAKKKPAAKKKAAAKKKKKKAPFVSKHPPKPRTREMLALIDKFRKVCLALPDTTEQEESAVRFQTPAETPHARDARADRQVS